MNIPSLGEIQNLVSKIKASVATFKNSQASLLDKAGSVIPVASQIIGDLFPAASIAGFGVTKILGVVGGLATAEPDITAAFSNVEAAVTGGAPPTDADWKTFDAAADKAHADLHAALAAYQKSG